MKTVAVATLLCLVVVVVQSARLRREEEKYTTQYDNVNLEDILHNKRLVKGYADCLLDKAPCNPDAQTLKDALPDALQNECAKCSEKQKEGVKITIPFLIKEEPEIWEELKKKHDPERKFEQLYQHYLDEIDEKKN